MTETLFVYGTLMPNCPNGHVLEEINGKFIPATVKGNLKNAGWSASMGYPGIKLDESGDTVHGYLFYSHNLINYWDYLAEFQREEVTVTRYDEIEVDTYIYSVKVDEDMVDD